MNSEGSRENTARNRKKKKRGIRGGEGEGKQG